MKATLLTSAIAFCAVTAFAADQQAAQQQQTVPPETQVGSRAVPVQTLSAPQTTVAGDSPLVAAAKRSGRLGKKPSAVITNDTLIKTGGHFTTTKSQEALPDAPAAAAGKPGASDAPMTTAGAPAAAAPQKSEAQRAADAKATNEAAAKAARRAMADYMGDTAEGVSEDPATQEGVMRQGVTPAKAQAPKPIAPPAAPQKPPTE